MSTDIATQYAFPVDPRPGHGHIEHGEAVVSFRGDSWTYTGVARKAYGNSEGRVSVQRRCPDAVDVPGGDPVCTHMWHYGGVEKREFFPSVFGLHLGTENGEEA